MAYTNADNWFRLIDRKIGPKGARIFMLAAFALVLASTPARGWQSNLVDYPGGSGRLIELDTVGNPVVLGGAEIVPGSYAMRVAKFAQGDGTLLWTREVSGTRDVIGVVARALAIDANGDAIAAGFADNEDPTGDFIVFKVDGADGALLWRKDVTGGGGDAYGVATDASGDVIAAGVIGGNFAVVKLAGADGTELWRAEINGTEDFSSDSAYGVAVDSAGNAVAIGVTKDATTRATLTVAKFAAVSGTLLWRRDILGDSIQPGGGFYNQMAVRVAADDDVIATGFVYNANTQSDFAVVRFDGDDGSEVWRREIDGGVTGSCGLVCKSDLGYLLDFDPSGAIIIGGHTSNTSGTGDFTVAKLADADGSIVWRRDLKGVGGKTAGGNGLSADTSGNIVTVSGTSDFPRVYFTLTKLSGADGSTLWADTATGYRVDVDTDAADNIVASGSPAEFGGTNSAFTVVKLDGADGSDFFAAVCGDGVVTAPEQCDDGNGAGGDGCSAVCEDDAPNEMTSDTSAVGPFSVSTDGESDGATAADPVEATITSPNPGTVSIEERPFTISSPPGFRMLSREIYITAPPATASVPLVLDFQLHISRLPVGTDESNLQIMRNATTVPACSGTPGTAAPDPCVSSRGLVGDTVAIEVLSSAASPWRYTVDACGARPQAGCLAPVPGQKNTLQVKVKDDPLKSNLGWKRTKEPVTTKTTFGAPLTTTNYDLCIYDGTSSLISHVSMPAGGICANDKPCWKETSSGFKYANKTANGAVGLVLKQGLEPGKAKIVVRGKGTLADVPSLPLTVAPVRVQLKHSDGECWDVVYSTPTRSDAEQFKANAD